MRLAVFAPCYIALDWASYIDPVGPFNITPWNPQPALAIVWMMLGGFIHAPAVFVTIVMADVFVRHTPGGYEIATLTALVLASGYAAIAWALKSWLSDTGLRSTRQLTLFVTAVVGGTGVVGAGFIYVLHAASLLGQTTFGNAWIRFWIGDAVGMLVTAPLLFAAADAARRSALLSLARRPEALLQAFVLAGTVWLIFEGFGSDPSRQFYLLLFLPPHLDRGALRDERRDHGHGNRADRRRIRDPCRTGRFTAGRRASGAPGRLYADRAFSWGHGGPTRAGRARLAGHFAPCRSG